MQFYGKCGTAYFTDGHSETIVMYDDELTDSIETESGRYFWKKVLDTIPSPMGATVTYLTERVEWYKYDPTVFLNPNVEQSPWFYAGIDHIEIEQWIRELCT